jgi:heat shock protein HspQ
MPHFECGAFDHSATSPRKSKVSAGNNQRVEARRIGVSAGLAKGVMLQLIVKVDIGTLTSAPEGLHCPSRSAAMTMNPLTDPAACASGLPGSAVQGDNEMIIAKFKIGDVVRHRVFPFRGVIFDVDPEFANTEDWWNSIPEEIRPSKDQPFYHLFAENDQNSYVAYVSQQNLLVDDSLEPVNHPAIDEIFSGFKDGSYIQRRDRMN